jgi:Ca2+-binding RTX toxin-like protein
LSNINHLICLLGNYYGGHFSASQAMTTLQDISSTPLSGHKHIDALLDSGMGWNWVTTTQNTLRYTFSTSSGTESSNGNISGPISVFNAAQQQAVRDILAYVQKLTGIVFEETTVGSAADFHFASCDIAGSSTSGLCSTSYRYSYSNPSNISSYEAEAYIYLDNVQFGSQNNSPLSGTNGYQTLLHEIGHALGLKHPFEGSTTLPSDTDNTSYTLMSYTNIGGPYSTFSSYDVAALMWLYGGDGLGGNFGVGTAGRYLNGTNASEQLTGGNGNDKLYGMGGNDTLNGGNGNDTLDGGSGNDLLAGGIGNDSYHVRIGDLVNEDASAGTDTVYSYLASHTLGSNIENGRIMNTGGATIIGNSLNNFLYAGQGNNTIDGGNGWDSVSFAYGVSGSGGVTANLATGQVSGSSGTDTLIGIERLYGSNNADTLIGNITSNTLSGGLGNDTLTGGAGNDIFRFDKALSTTQSQNLDKIVDFSVVDDTIQLENSIFTALIPTGVLSAANFVSNNSPKALDANDFILHDKDNGALYYDVDGNGHIAAIQIATIGINLNMSSADFVVT